MERARDFVEHFFQLVEGTFTGNLQSIYNKISILHEKLLFMLTKQKSSGW